MRETSATQRRKARQICERLRNYQSSYFAFDPQKVFDFEFDAPSTQPPLLRILTSSNVTARVTDPGAEAIVTSGRET